MCPEGYRLAFPAMMCYRMSHGAKSKAKEFKRSAANE